MLNNEDEKSSINTTTVKLCLSWTSWEEVT